MMQQHHEYVEHPEGRGRHDEEVDGDEVGEVVLKERSPGLRRWLRATRHEPGNGPLRDVEAELEKLAVNAGRAPEGIRERHGAYEIRKLRADRRATRSPAAGLPGPESAEALPVPANHGLGAERGGAPFATQSNGWRATPRGGDRGARIAVASSGDGAGQAVAGAQ